jgi:hypothetical protein
MISAQGTFSGDRGRTCPPDRRARAVLVTVICWTAQKIACICAWRPLTQLAPAICKSLPHGRPGHRHGVDGADEDPGDYTTVTLLRTRRSSLSKTP